MSVAHTFMVDLEGQPTVKPEACASIANSDGSGSPSLWLDRGLSFQLDDFSVGKRRDLVLT
jgi:hypothetical protein